MNLNDSLTTSKPPLFTPNYKPNQLICGYGRVAIVTGWTPTERIAEQLDPYEYAMIGNLFRPNPDINFLVRHVLSSPSIRKIVILNAKAEDINNGAGYCLKDLVYHGVSEGKSNTGRNCWVINSCITGYIDKEISCEAINSLSNSIAVSVCHYVTDAIREVRKFNVQSCDYLPLRKKFVFPYADQ